MRRAIAVEAAVECLLEVVWVFGEEFENWDSPGCDGFLQLELVITPVGEPLALCRPRRQAAKCRQRDICRDPLKNTEEVLEESVLKDAAAGCM
jgi:hypothetical protein